MTENPTTTLGNYDLLAERGQQGFVLSPSIPGEGLKISGQRPRGSFARAAEKPAANNPAAYDDQSMLGQILINILMMITGKLDADKSGNNQLMSLISKAFGMQDDSNHTEFRQLQKDVQTRGREKVRGERDFSKFDQESATAAVRHNNTYSTTPVNADTYQKFINHLRDREGYKREVYLDSEGKLTVGVGHLVLPQDELKLGDKISDAQVINFLEKDGRKAFEAAQRQAAELGVKDESFVTALGSVNFQLGTGWRDKFKSTWATMKDGDFSGAATKLESSLWNRQTPTRVDDFQLALRKAETTTGAFGLAASGIPTPPTTNNPTLVAAAQIPDNVVTRRPQAALTPNG